MSDRRFEQSPATGGVVYLDPIPSEHDMIPLGLLDASLNGAHVELTAEQARELRDKLELRIAEVEGAFA